MILSCRHLHIDSFVETWQLENGGKVPSPYNHCASAYREQNQSILWMKRKLSIFGLCLGPIKRSYKIQFHYRLSWYFRSKMIDSLIACPGDGTDCYAMYICGASNNGPYSTAETETAPRIKCTRDNCFRGISGLYELSFSKLFKIKNRSNLGHIVFSSPVIVAELVAF